MNSNLGSALRIVGSIAKYVADNAPEIKERLAAVLIGWAKLKGIPTVELIRHLVPDSEDEAQRVDREVDDMIAAEFKPKVE